VPGRPPDPGEPGSSETPLHAPSTSTSRAAKPALRLGFATAQPTAFAAWTSLLASFVMGAPSKRQRWFCPVFQFEAKMRRPESYATTMMICAGLGKLVGDSFFDSTRWTDGARIHAYAADHLVLALAAFSLKNFSFDRRLPTCRSLLFGA
jgi:hypothetical protein